MNLVKRSSDVDFNKIIQNLNEEKVEQDKAKMNKIKAKVLTMARFNLLLKRGQDNSEHIAEVKKIYPDEKLPVGSFMDNFKGTKYDLNNFVAGH